MLLHKMREPWACNPDVLDGTCANRKQLPERRGKRYVSGPFQMTDATYQQDIRQALAQNPGLCRRTAESDPATQAIAASQDLKTPRLDCSRPASRTRLCSTPAAPTISAPPMAFASPSARQSKHGSAADPLHPRELAANGITSTTTVGQWRQSIINKLGSAARAPVLGA